MILSKAVRSSVSAHGHRSSGKLPECKTVLHDGKKPNSIPDFLQLLDARDYKGAITVLQFQRMTDPCEKKTLEWLAYAHFHRGEHDKALLVYRELLDALDADSIFHTFAAACLFYMAAYEEAIQAALKGPECALQRRILLHVAHRQNDEKGLLEYRNGLGDSPEDQLSLASIHFMRTQYQEAIDIYKKLLLSNRDWLVLNVFLALCYCDMDYYDVSLEILDGYLQVREMQLMRFLLTLCYQVHPDSPLAVNVKACNKYKLFDGKTAEADLKPLLSGGPIENDLVNHNIVVFRNGEGALQALPPMIDILPEARMNLVLHHLKHGETREAYGLVKTFEPTTPQEFIVKAVCCASLGQEMENAELLRQAQQCFQLVGSSASECDTIPGRQCMASCHFLLKQFDDALVYLKVTKDQDAAKWLHNFLFGRLIPVSIRDYSGGQDEFNWNYGMALAASGNYEEAEEALLSIKNEESRSEYHYQAWLSQCYIANGKANLAWELHLSTEASSASFSLLLLIANECYKTGQYLYASKAFDLLGRMDDSSEFWEGKRGALVGVFQNVVSGDEPKETLLDILALLQNTNKPQAEYIVRIIKKWVRSA